MGRLNDVLEAEGTLLVVVPTPLRGMVNGEVVTDAAALEALEIDFDADEAQAYFHDYVRSLTSIVAVDLLGPARSLNGKSPGFQFKLDQHWTPEGSKVAAQTVAEALLASPAYKEVSPPVPTAFATSAVGSQESPNRIFELIEENCGDLPDKLMETMTLYETEAVSESQDLFASETPFVTLVGSSFSGGQYNFAGFLSEALGQKVLNNYVSGGRFYTSLADYLLKRTPETRSKVIIWEYRMTDAINVENQEDFTPFREMIPSTYGACSAETSLLSNSTEVSGTTFTVLENPSNGEIQGENYYLHMQASDLSLVEFEITLTHEDGSVDTAPIERSTRVSNTGEYFLELPRNIASPLREVSLSVPGGTTGTVEAQICGLRTPVIAQR